MDYHNFALVRYYGAEALDFRSVLDEAVAQSEEILPMLADVPGLLYAMRHRGDNLLFEGAQGAMLDIDHGTYPFVTSSTTTAGGAASGSGIGPRHLDFILGIVKAYTTRVGAGPFPTELFDSDGERLGERGHEFGATTGRKRRCGWLDMVALKRSFEVNSVSGICITKLDVLDGSETVKICTDYELDGERLQVPPTTAEALARCRPVYLELPGWNTSTVGITTYDALPPNARGYLAKIKELSGLPIDILSTGPDRTHTVVIRHPFDE